LQELRPFEHGKFGLNRPYGPCIICLVTILYRSGYFTLSGSSTQMRRSYCSGHVSLYLCYIIRRKWEWGKPLFWNSTTYTRAFTLPSICFLNNIFFSSIMRTPMDDLHKIVHFLVCAPPVSPSIKLSHSPWYKSARS
jgi:hypothetical protein